MMTMQPLRFIVTTIMALLAITVWVFPRPAQRLAAAGEGIGGVPGRISLHICVANHNGSPIAGEVMRKVHTAFAKVRQHPDFEAAGLNGGDGPTIRAGCPSPSTLNTERWGRNTVAHPGSIHTYVFIAPAEEIQRTQFKHYPRVVGHEQMCEGAHCASVANAVYLTPEELNDPEALIRSLLAGIGLSASYLETPVYTDQVTPDRKPQQ